MLPPPVLATSDKGCAAVAFLPYHSGLMATNPVPAGQPPATQPPVPPPAQPQAARSDAEAHYTNLLAYFKHLVWLTGIALGVVILVAGYLFHSNLQDNLRDVRQDAKGEATRVATEEAEKGVKTVLSGTNMNELVQKVAREGVAEAVTGEMVENKVGPIADKMIEQQLASKLQPIEQRIVLIGRISECEARIHAGFRSALEELTGIMNTTHDPTALQFAKSTLASTSEGYDTYWQTEMKGFQGLKPLNYLQMTLSRPGTNAQPQNLHDVVQLIDSDQNLNTVALAFIVFRDLTGDKVKMFDFPAVKSWCAKNPAKC
jgi:hypothetical protein